MQFFDTGEDDARMVATVARTAAAHGAQLATRASVVELCRAGDRITGAVVRDEQSRATLTIPARSVALAVGASTDGVRADSGAPSTTRCGRPRGSTLSCRTTGSR